MVQVWMDSPYSDTITHYLSDKNFTAGDLESRHAIRTRNRCKPYKYFVDVIRSISNVYIPDKIQNRGSLRNIRFKRCVDLAKTNNQLGIILYPCHEMVTSNQYFILTETNQIRCIEGNLFDVERKGDDVKLKLRRSPSVYSHPDSEWKYSGNHVKHVSTGLCLTAFTRDNIGLSECTEDTDQFWDWDRVE